MTIFCVSCTTWASDLVHVGHRKQLLVDDYVIAEMTGVVRELGKVTKLNDGKPVFDGLFFGSVLYDEGKFKLWYRAYPYGYAESSDGLHFRKIAHLTGLDIVSDNTATFYIDPHESDPAHRYKACYSHRTIRAALAYSADGIHWKAYNNGNPVTHRASDTSNQIMWDEDAKAYRLFTRTDFGTPGGAGEIRGTRSMTNPDVKADPTAWTLVREWKFDREGPEEWKRRQVYALNDWIYHGVHFALILVYEWPEDMSEGPADYHKRHNRNILEYYIATSRDGDSWDLTWVYAGKPMVPRGPDGAWDKDIMVPASEIVTHADKHWLYYSGGNERHGMPRPLAGIGVATLRLDGFVCLEATDEPGTIVTKPFTFEGDKLRINVWGDEILVEVLNRKSEPIPGFSAKEATEYKNMDELRLTPTWKNDSRLSTLKGRVIRLRFHLKNARLYSFQVLE
ncbi:MAG: hypothetical protein E4H40_03405 [Candidatus Brocadiia bacterium]|nr:MAG: hypothetical protein E4H40_03405 [Candidatus Brocadiia bacterium]